MCKREHHTVCVGLDKAGDMFICGACQRRTQEKTIAGNIHLLLSPDVKRLKVTLCCYYGCRDLDR